MLGRFRSSCTRLIGARVRICGGLYGDELHARGTIMSGTRPFDRANGFGDCSMKDGGLRAGGQCFGCFGVTARVRPQQAQEFG
ncbi:unnamed protein product, partial [Pylaiella littoralis]